MSYSTVTYTGNGATTSFAVPFPYLDPLHIAVTVNGVAASFAWLNASLVSVTPAPAANAVVLIARNSNRVARLAHYQDAQVLDEVDMDNDALQLFYVAQEAFDAVADAASGGDMRRSMNLSDVYDLNAARGNLSAVNKAGDTMTGPLDLWGPPSAPNEAVTKSYVDALTGGGSGSVSSFNNRTGAVSLLNTDVVAAIGYTPVNKAGDTMLGVLTLAADPANPLDAATKQYVDAHGGGGGSTGEYIFGPANPGYAAAQLNKVQSAPTAANAGAANLYVTRTGGVAMTSFQHYYFVKTNGTPGTGDVGMTSQIIAQSGAFAGFSGIAFGPRSNPGVQWQPIGAYFNAVERVSDQGYQNTRAGNATISVLVAPMQPSNIGDGPGLAFNTTFGIAFTAATPASSTQRMWTPLFFELDCTVPTGIQAEHRGGSTLPNAPKSAIEIRDFFTNGIDTRSATFDPASDNTAIWLNQGQAIHLGPLQRMYVDPSGNLTFFDSVAGSHTLLSLGGGSGVSILPLNNIWTGTNKFNGTSADTVIGTEPLFNAKITRTSPTGTLANTQTALLVETVTNSGTADLVWNGLFRLDNFANGGQNVSVYSAANKHSASGPTWAGVMQVNDSADGTGAVYGLEVDLCADGLSASATKSGVAIFYGANTNTFGAGSTTKQTYGLHIAPFVSGRNQLGSGIAIDGYCDEAVSVNASGLSALHASGSYSDGVINMTAVTNSPYAIGFAPGSRLLFKSGIGNGSNQTWRPGGYVPAYIGAIAVLVDGTEFYIPVSSNHP